jgi:hypothetical protein
MNLDIRTFLYLRLLFHLSCWVIFIGLFIWAGNIIIAEAKGTIRLFRWLFIGLPRKRRGKKLVERARDVGKVAVFNTEKNIAAVCSYSSFKTWIGIERELISSVEDEGKRLRMLVSPVMVLPENTFTFAGDEDSNPYVTGTRRDMDQLLADLVRRATGYQRRQVNRDAFNVACGYLVVKDKRLIVPFVREGVLPNGRYIPSMDEQVRSHGSRHLLEARQHILDLV